MQDNVHVFLDWRKYLLKMSKRKLMIIDRSFGTLNHVRSLFTLSVLECLTTVVRQ